MPRPCPACLAALALVAPGCDRLLDDTVAFESVSIAAPRDGDTALGAEVLAVAVQTDCNQVSSIEILVDDVVAGYWPARDGAQPVCDGPPTAYCIDAELSPALRQGRFWPARLEASMTCAGRPGRFLSPPLDVKVAPFDGLSFLPAAATSLLVGSDAGVLAVSGGGLHRIDSATGDVTTVPHLSRHARALRVSNDVYYYAPCEPPLLCDAAAPNLYRIAAGTLAPTGDRARLDCAPLAVTDAGARRAMLLGDCSEPRVRWSAPDLSDPVDAPLGAAPTGQAARRGDELAMLAFDGDELVIVAAADAPPLATRRTGVRAAAAVAAISADGERAAVLDPATGQVVHVDVAIGATVGAVALPAGLGVTAFAYVPGTHDLLVVTSDHSWRVTADAAEPLLERPRRGDRPVRIRAALPIDGRRAVVIAADDDGTPFVFASDGASLTSIATLGPDWELTAGPLVTADGDLYLSFATAEGPVVVRHRAGE